MANVREIKNRIKGVRDTQKITNAMYLIASTKMQKARAALEQAQPYFEAAKAEVKRMFHTSEGANSIYFFPTEKEEELNGTYGCLVITADKGLAGAYNQSVIKEAQRLLSAHPDTKLFVVGEYGRQFFTKHQIPIEQSFLYTAQNPTIHRAREIADVLLEQYEAGELKKIFIVYTDMKNRLSQEVRTSRLLPLHRTYFAETDENDRPLTQQFEFVPSVELVLGSIMRGLVAGYLYGALVDSFCCEQNARMTAMDAANRNAEKLLADLTVQYNRLRQAAITQEITEVSAGAKAQKRAHAKAAQKAAAAQSAGQTT